MIEIIYVCTLFRIYVKEHNTKFNHINVILIESWHLSKLYYLNIYNEQMDMDLLSH